MRLAIGLTVLTIATACAPLQESRTPADLACTQEAERVVLQQNRARSVRLDAIDGRTDTQLDARSFSGFQINASEYAQRERLRRECLGRANAAEAPMRTGPAGAAPAQAAPTPGAPGQPAPRPPAVPGW